ncbi:hypothetical protein [Flaviaesturariibacter flavus]|uniref:hypothetical protein n=1 Tax=Flaviaesturariibacter flavus TaxID=2502780 RepID=UPI001404E2E7|nr:hypothetical protein [Flaviaesturariibacter flavus]
MKQSWRRVVVPALLLALLQQATLSLLPAFTAGNWPHLPLPASLVLWLPDVN